MEKNRLEATAGWLFKDFVTIQDYNTVCDYANELGWVMWKSPQKRMFFCRDEGKATMIDFINRKILKST
jgi:hypothetical protein